MQAKVRSGRKTLLSQGKICEFYSAGNRGTLMVHMKENKTVSGHENNAKKGHVHSFMQIKD